MRVWFICMEIADVGGLGGGAGIGMRRPGVLDNGGRAVEGRQSGGEMYRGWYI